MMPCATQVRSEGGKLLVRLAQRSSELIRRWLPDPFVFAVLLTIITGVTAMLWVGAGPTEVLQGWYQGFWMLLEFGMQMVLIFFIAKRRGYPREMWPGLGQTVGRFLVAVPALLTPIILLGGIYSGVFTPTESAAVAALTAIIIGFFQRTLHVGDIPKILETSAKVSGVIVPIIAMSLPLAQTLASLQVPQAFVNFMTSLTSNPYLIIIIMVAILMIAGCVMETTPNIVILAPLLLPLAFHPMARIRPPMLPGPSHSQAVMPPSLSGRAGSRWISPWRPTRRLKARLRPSGETAPDSHGPGHWSRTDHVAASIHEIDRFESTFRSFFNNFSQKCNSWRTGASQYATFRNPVNIRPLLGIKKDYNPKGLGLFLSGYIKQYSITGSADYLQKIKQIILLGVLKFLT